MALEYLCSKVLDDGTKLAIRTWISNIFKPGERMYQLELSRGSERKIYPENFQEFTITKAEEAYAAIKSQNDFDKLGDVVRS